MSKWTVADGLMYQEYLQWRSELCQLQQCRRNIDKERIEELEENIKKYLNGCGVEALRNIVLWSLDIGTEI